MFRLLQKCNWSFPPHFFDFLLCCPSTSVGLNRLVSTDLHLDLDSWHPERCQQLQDGFYTLTSFLTFPSRKTFTPGASDNLCLCLRSRRRRLCSLPAITSVAKTACNLAWSILIDFLVVHCYNRLKLNRISYSHLVQTFQDISLDTSLDPFFCIEIKCHLLVQWHGRDLIDQELFHDRQTHRRACRITSHASSKLTNHSITTTY